MNGKVGWLLVAILVAYLLALGGPSAVKAWAKAKFMNQPVQMLPSGTILT